MHSSLGNSAKPSVAVLFLVFSSLILWQGSSRAGDPKSTEEVYLDKCSVCHGADGAGKTAKGRKLKVKDLRSPEIQKLSDAQLYEVIAKGKGKDMDGWEKELGKEKVHDLVAYMRELAKKK